MAKAQKFEDLAVFQMARDLCKEVYVITKSGEFSKDSRFVLQIRAAAGSIMDNIAEGFERDGNKEFVNFLYIAKGSCGEVRSQIIRASDVGFIDNETATKLYNDCINESTPKSPYAKNAFRSVTFTDGFVLYVTVIIDVLLDMGAYFWQIESTIGAVLEMKGFRS